ncbi:MAG: ATP-binding cassette domain-containing protein [Phycisphaerae bacterium]|nr:ATP-binding cassette domain-containing protein [Phycisphaerae bacterium]MDW8261126.1 ATP-binding cassette domain-containing protein [Phycisphaerales bacterium]
MNGNFNDAAAQPAVQLQGVGVLAGGRWILRGVNLSIAQGACCALLGPNGCGKSTLARVLAGWVWPTEGRVCVLGERFGQTDLHALRRRIRLVQSESVHDFDGEMTVEQVVLTGAFGTILLHDPPSDADRLRARERMAWLGIDHLRSARYGTLSTGERMRALVARALLEPPTLLLLDEPTAGLDLPARELLLEGLDQAMRQAACRPTILMISHHVEELPESIDQAILMRAGRIAAAGPADQVLAEGPMSMAFDAPIEVLRVGRRYTARSSRRF